MRAGPHGPLESPETGLSDRCRSCGGQAAGHGTLESPVPPPPPSRRRPCGCARGCLLRSLSIVSLWLAGLLLALTQPAAHAAQGTPGEERIVVTATRIPEPLDEVLAPVIVIDRPTIERAASNDTAELLRFHAGVEIGRNGGPGQTTAVFLRGAESNHTLIMIDGVRINPGTIGLAALQNISPDLIERIEIVKGPRSALYGSDAIGGVINVITRRGARDGWTAELGYGDYATRKASLSGGLQAGTADLDFGLSWLDSDGFPTRSVDDTDRGFENLNASAQLRGEIGPAGFALRYWRAEGTTEYSDFFLTPVDQDFETSTAAAELRWPAAGSMVALRFSHMDDRIEQNQSDDFLRTRRDSLDLQLDGPADGLHALSTGLLLAREHAASESFGEGLRVDTDTINVFLQDRISAAAHHALVAVGYTEHETAGSAFTWNLEYGYALSERATLYALAGTGFRAPDATDRYGYGGNPDLKPEHSRSVEAGLRLRHGERHSLRVAAFENDIQDLIEFVTLSYDPFLGENRNLAEARIRGIEAAYEYRQPGWRLGVEAVLQDPENLETGEDLFRRARESLTLTAVRSLGPVELGLDLLATGSRKDFGFPQAVELDSYVLANLNATWHIGPRLELSGRIENLLDEDYELAHTYNTPGRGLYLSLRYTPAGGARPAGLADQRNHREAPQPGQRPYLRGMHDQPAAEELAWVTD